MYAPCFYTILYDANYYCEVRMCQSMPEKEKNETICRKYIMVLTAQHRDMNILAKNVISS